MKDEKDTETASTSSDVHDSGPSTSNDPDTNVSKNVTWQLVGIMFGAISIVMTAMWTVAITVAEVLKELRGEHATIISRIIPLEKNTIDVDQRIKHEKRHGSVEADVERLKGK